MQKRNHFCFLVDYYRHYVPSESGGLRSPCHSISTRDSKKTKKVGVFLKKKVFLEYIFWIPGVHSRPEASTKKSLEWAQPALVIAMIFNNRVDLMVLLFHFAIIFCFEWIIYLFS